MNRSSFNYNILIFDQISKTLEELYSKNIIPSTNIELFFFGFFF